VPSTLYLDLTMPKVRLSAIRLSAIRQNLYVFGSSVLALIAQIVISHCPISHSR